MDPVKGSEVIVRELLMPKLTETYEQLASAVAGADLLVSHPITYAAPVVAEQARLPWLSTVLAPMLFFSEGRSARAAGGAARRTTRARSARGSRA